MKKKGYNGHNGLWREKPCKIRRKMTKKIIVEPCQVVEKEESLKTFEKGVLNKSRSNF